MQCTPLARRAEIVLVTAFAGCMALAVTAYAQVAEVAPFLGEFSGSAEVIGSDGSATPRDMSVTIAESRDGFNVSWSTTTYKSDGRIKEQSYSVDFLPTDRDGVFSAAMTRNVFGHAVQLDPMKGEPFVWGRIAGDTLTVYSLFVDDDGSYEMQQYDRSLRDEGLLLTFSRVREGEKLRTVETVLERQ